jgi:5-(carboxyamino)imidazole ribonucleotide synthase
MPSTMVNLIGAAPATAELAAVKRAHVHLYGKAPRPGRKVGHVTVTRGGDWEAAAALADAV